MIKSVFCILLVCSNALADDVVYLNKGTAAPNDGYLFTPAKATEVRNKALTFDDIKSQNTSYQHSINLYIDNENIYQKQIDLLTTQNNKLVNAEQTAVSMSTYEKIGWFTLGIIGTGLAFEAAKAAIRN